MLLFQQEALSRLYRFASESIFEIKVAGRFTSDLVRAAIKASTYEALYTYCINMCFSWHTCKQCVHRVVANYLMDE